VEEETTFPPKLRQKRPKLPLEVVSDPNLVLRKKTNDLDRGDSELQEENQRRSDPG